jgi:hypothetical protein
VNTARIDTSLEVANRVPIARDDIEAVVGEILKATPFIDIHTHLYPSAFGKLGLWGIDDLLTYHYLEAEFFRSSRIQPEEYWRLDKSRRADLVWQTLFVENTPVSEAAIGVVAVLHALGLSTSSTSLAAYRQFFFQQDLADYMSRILRESGIGDVVMTNDPLDVKEASKWRRGVRPDPGFHAALRLDRIVNEWESHCDALVAQQYAVQGDAQGNTIKEIRRFLAEWVGLMKPLYMAVSLPDSFLFPADDIRTMLLRGAVLPACREADIPMALMIGVRRGVNARLKSAGDASGRADLRTLENLCTEFPDNRFLVSVLSRENQHELCVYARKFSNILPFGCWWFLNNPSIVEEITHERLEMLGTTFIPQHSDARVLEQLIYKWHSTRRTIGPVFARTYRVLVDNGRPVTRGDVQRDVTRLFRTNFQNWTRGL